jgi:hypothetical protein
VYDILEATAITRRSAMTQPPGGQPAYQRAQLSAEQKAARPDRRMSALSRQRHPVQLEVRASSVENVVRAIRDNQDQKTLLVKVSDDGRLRARIPATTRHNTPALIGQLEADGDSVMLRGVIREPVTAVAAVRVYLTMAIVLLLLAILQAGHPVPGGVVCGACGILLGLTGYWLARGRVDGFSRDCEELMGEVTSLLPAGHHHLTLSPRTLATLAGVDRVLTRITRSGRSGPRRSPPP